MYVAAFALCNTLYSSVLNGAVEFLAATYVVSFDLHNMTGEKFAFIPVMSIAVLSGSLPMTYVYVLRCNLLLHISNDDQVSVLSADSAFSMTASVTLPYDAI